MDIKKLELLLDTLANREIREFQYKDAEIELSIAFGGVVPVAPVVTGTTVSMATPPKLIEEAGVVTIESPMVGTFYRASSPGAQAFVEIGSTIRCGQSLCIVEAMKLMNEIESDVAGTILEILVDNAQPVQFGQPLFKIRKG